MNILDATLYSQSLKHLGFQPIKQSFYEYWQDDNQQYLVHQTNMITKLSESIILNDYYYQLAKTVFNPANEVKMMNNISYNTIHLFGLENEINQSVDVLAILDNEINDGIGLYEKLSRKNFQTINRLNSLKELRDKVTKILTV